MTYLYELDVVHLIPILKITKKVVDRSAHICYNKRVERERQ